MSAVKKTVIKVSVNCGRCKKDILKAVTKLEGINQVTVEAEKGTLILIGIVDPIMVVKQLKKAGKFVEIVSVGPPEPPEPKPPVKPKPEPPPEPKPFCNDCQLVAVGFEYYGDRPACHIL